MIFSLNVYTVFFFFDVAVLQFCHSLSFVRPKSARIIFVFFILIYGFGLLLSSLEVNQSGLIFFFFDE
jgi:hypothetical protein